jgi:hypothetical protein
VEKNTSKAYVEPTGLIAGALAPTGEAGTSLFLINLCASMAPVQLTSKTLPGLENYRLYQVTRVEDGRTRYRLRLGFFATEAEAEDVLAKVREQYPTAFTACLCEEDRRHTRGYVVKAAPAKSQMSVVRSNPAKPTVAKSVPKPTTTPAAAPKATKPAASPGIEVSVEPKASNARAQSAARPAAASAADIISVDDLSWDPPALDAKTPKARAAATGSHQTLAPGFKTQPVIKAEPAKAKGAAAATTPKADPKIDPAASMRVRALELTLSDPPAPAAEPRPRNAPNEPFHVGKGVDIPTTALSLQAEAAASTKAAAPNASAAKTTAPTHKAGISTPANITPTAKVATPPAKPAAAPAAVKAAAAPAAKAPAPVAKHPDLDSTQTIRALTSDELNDEAQEKWFAIQLAASEQPVNLDTMPHLDIFEAYRLYSVAIAGSGKIVHSLRLGFFKEAVSAEAVAGYLKTFFSSPTVLRISVAEQTRFKDATMPKKRDPEVRAQPNVIELDSARASRVPTVTMEVVPPAAADTSATGSFKLNSTGSFRTSDTAKHRTLGSVKPAAKSAAPATKRSPPMTSKKSSTTGKYKMPVKKSLAEQLLDEAKEVELSESGIYKMPKNDSLLSRLVDKLKK